MLSENTTIHLRRGCQTLTIANRAGRFVGLIDGYPYITSMNPNHVIRYLVLTSTGGGRDGGGR